MKIRRATQWLVIFPSYILKWDLHPSLPNTDESYGCQQNDCRILMIASPVKSMEQFFFLSSGSDRTQRRLKVEDCR